MISKSLLFAYVASFCGNLANSNSDNDTPIYSAPPSELPIRKIYIHNRPVYVRQMFAAPQRHQIKSPALYANNYPYQSPYMSAGPSAVNSFSHPFDVPAQTPNFSPVSCNFPQQVSQPTAPQVPYYVQAPSYINAPVYPLQQCYTNSNNFMCCNKTLENVIIYAFQSLQQSRPNWSSCNVNKLATVVQSHAELAFNTTFEVIAGVGDYASKSHFYSDLICKVIVDGKVVLAYATRREDAESYYENRFKLDLPPGGNNAEPSYTSDNGASTFKNNYASHTLHQNPIVEK